MPLDSKRIQTRIDSVMRRLGEPMKITRQGVAVGTGYGMFVTKAARLETSPDSVQTVIGSRTLKLSGATKEPKVGDTVTHNKVSYQVVGVEASAPGSVVLAYTLELT